MNAKYILAASLTGGLISALLANTPYVNLINLLVCAGFWMDRSWQSGSTIARKIPNL